jgi:hypothetical protein
VAIDTNDEQSVDRGTESASSVTNIDQITDIPACGAVRPTSVEAAPTNRMARPISVATNGKDVPFSAESSRPSSQAANNEESLRKRRKPKARHLVIFLITNFAARV